MAIKMFVSDLSRGKKNKWGSGLKFIFSGAAGLPLKELEAIMDNDVFIAFGYGMTEIAGPVAINSYMDKLGSVGKAAPRTRIEIRDNEIYIKNNSVMLGYYNDPEATAVAVKDGWIATGDYGYLDEEGFLYITGRKKNLIILSSGENVSPEELEARLYANRAVKECKVYEKGDRIAADIYAPEATEEEIRAFVSDLNGKLPGFKRIYSVRFLKSEMEKTASGKIKR
jgi:long-chain acyl-CoA synthetase